VGITNKHDALGTFSRQTIPTNHYLGVGGHAAPTKIENGSATLASSSMKFQFPRYDVASSWYRGLITVRFRRAGTTWNIDTGYVSYWADFTMEDVWEALEWPLYGFQVISNGGQILEQAGNSLTVDESTYGNLTHFNIWWNKSVPKLEIFGVAVQRYK
jgi:hypothetical protein